VFKVRHREGGKPTERWSIAHSKVVPIRLSEDGAKVKIKIPASLSEQLAGKVFVFETLDLDSLVGAGQPKRQDLLRKIEVLRVEEAIKRIEKKKRQDGDDNEDPSRPRRRRDSDDDDRPRRAKTDDDDDRPRRAKTDDDDDRPRRAKTDDDDDRPRRAKAEDPGDDFASEDGLFDHDGSNGDRAKAKAKPKARKAPDDEIDF